MANNRTLLPVSGRMPDQGEPGEWHSLTGYANEFIDKIDAGKQDDNVVYSSDVLAADVTGYPSPWARSKFFKIALSFSVNEEDNSSLGTIYRNLREEWMGLIATITAFSEHIETEVVELYHEDEDEYSLARLLGDSLFNDRNAWCDPSYKDGKIPFIQLIKYDGEIIAATSPDVILFPAVSYATSALKDVPWYDKDNKRFVKPKYEDLKRLDGKPLKYLYLILSKIVKNIKRFETMKNFIDGWVKEINKNKGDVVLDERGVLARQLKFIGFIGQVLSCSDKVFEMRVLQGEDSFVNGYYFDKNDDERFEWEEVNLADYMLKDGTPVPELFFGTPEKTVKKKDKDLDVYTLNNELIDDGNGRRFFPLPLSEKGLKRWCSQTVGKGSVEDLLKPINKEDGNDNMPHITLDSIENNSIKVTLSVRIESDVKVVKFSYPISNAKNATNFTKNCVLWPNFTSAQWKEYYLYTEYVEEQICGMITKPFYYYYPDERTPDGKRFVFDKNEDDKTWLLVGEKKKEDNLSLNIVGSQDQDKDFYSEKIIYVPAVTSGKHKYDIWHSNKPIAGVALFMKDDKHKSSDECGYLLFKNKNQKKYLDITERKNQVIVGYDFGSNNSCIFYRLKDASDGTPLQFKNLRVFALGDDSGANNSYTQNATVDELMFFQNEEVNSQFKSWMITTDRDLKVVGTESNRDRAITGGMNVFEPNIDVKKIDASLGIMETNCGELYFNMKWAGASNDPCEAQRKTFIDAIWLQVQANLFDEKLVPILLNWSYPGAFINSLVRKLNDAYERELVTRRPIAGLAIPKFDKYTESESVFALMKSKSSPNKDTVNVAMDIGGSTTDLLIQLEKAVYQSSVCVAAGSVTSLFEESTELRRVAIEYQQRNDSNIPMVSIEQLRTKKDLSYYYVNTIFDIVGSHANESWAKDLYRDIVKNNSTRCTCALPAFITGFLAYYMGYLLRYAFKTAEGGPITTVNMINIYPVGKGSRLLDWLKPTLLGGEEDCVKYMEDCLRAGLADEEYKGISLKFRSVDVFKNVHDPKSVVAAGLVAGNNNSVIKAESLTLFGEEGLRNNQTGELIEGCHNLSKNSQDVYQRTLSLEQVCDSSEKFPVFKKFCNVFVDYLREHELFDEAQKRRIIEALEDLRTSEINAWIGKQPTFANQDPKAFEYKESYLVLEALYFMNEVLLPQVSRN